MAQTDFGGMGYGGTGAHCALHPDQPATRTCTRCGSFMCTYCSEEGTQTLCPSCKERMGVGEGFPLTRDTWSFSSLWDYCFEIFKRDWLMLSVGVLVFFGISFIVQLIANILPALGGLAGNEALSVVLTVAAVIVQSMVQGVLGLGLMKMQLAVLQGGKADIGQIFSQLHKVGTYILTSLLLFVMFAIPLGLVGGIAGGLVYALGESAMPVVVGVAVVLAIGPLIYFGLPLVLLQAEMASNDGASPMELIRNCYAYARDERLSILGVVMVGFLIVMAGVLACCVGVIPASALYYLLLGGLYLSLRTEGAADHH